MTFAGDPLVGSTTGCVVRRSCSCHTWRQRAAEAEVLASGAARRDAQPRVGERRAASGQGRQQGGAAEAPQHLPPGELHRCIVAGARRRGRGGVYPRPWAAVTAIRTYGCQMNVHDSERMAGLLEAAGYARAADPATADVVVFNTCAVRENADNKLYGNLGHLRPAQGRGPGHADRRRRLPGAEGPRDDRAQGAVGGRRVRHPQRRLAAGAAGAGPAQRGRAGGDPRVAGGVPVHAAGAAGVGLRRLGVDLRRLQQHLHVLHRALAARHRARPAAGRRARRGRGAGGRGRAGGDAARAERQLLRRGVRRPRRLREAAARLRRRAGARARPVHLAAPARLHR